MARNNNGTSLGCQSADGVEPRDREGIPKTGRVTLLNQVTGEGHVVGVKDGVAVGVPPAEIGHLDGAVTQVDGGPILKDLGRRCHHHAAKSIRLVRILDHEVVDLRQRDLDQLLSAIGMTPDQRSIEGLVPEGVIPVVVGVEHPAHREGRDEPEIGQQLPGMPGMGPGIDDEHSFVSRHEADVLIQELVPTAENAVSQFLPFVRDGHGATLIED